MDPFSIVSDAEFLGLMNVLLVHGGAFPSIVYIGVLERDKMLAHVFKFTDIDEVGGRIQDHIPMSVLEHFMGPFQIWPSIRALGLSGGGFAFACHGDSFGGFPFLASHAR
jgi:hypothetical protein